MFRFTFYGSHAHFQQKFCTICGAAFEPACVCVCVCMPSKIYGNQMHIGECIANGNVLNRCIKWTVFALHGPEIVQSYLKIEIQTGRTNERERERWGEWERMRAGSDDVRERIKYVLENFNDWIIKYICKWSNVRTHVCYGWGRTEKSKIKYGDWVNVGSKFGSVFPASFLHFLYIQ